MGMRVIIPVAGMGTRMKPHTYTTPKVCIQVAGKPMIGHILDELKRYDVDEVCLVVGHLAKEVEQYVTEDYGDRFKFKFVPQDEPKGLGHAIWVAADLYRNVESPLLVILGDTIFDANFDSIIGSDANWIGVREVEDARRFGVVELDENDKITNMLEKPDVPPTNLAIVGIYYFTDGRTIFSCLDKLIEDDITTKGEYQLTDALQMMLEQGSLMKPFRIDGWFDCGKPETHLQTNRELLDLYVRKGRLKPVDAGAYPTVVINPPVAIAEDATVENSVLGPYVTVAKGAIVRNTVVSDTVISRNAQVDNIVLKDSIVGENASVRGPISRLNIGDTSDITTACDRP